MTHSLQCPFSPSLREFKCYKPSRSTSVGLEKARRYTVAFQVEHTVRVACRKKDAIDCILNLRETIRYDPGVAEVELITPDLSPSDEGVTYKLKGIVRPFSPLFNDFQVNGFVYNKLICYDPEGEMSGGLPTIVREQKTVQGAGVEVWMIKETEVGGVELTYKYNSSGFPDVPDAETTWEQWLFAKLNIFKFFDGVVGFLTRGLIIQSLEARKKHLESSLL